MRSKILSVADHTRKIFAFLMKRERKKAGMKRKSAGWEINETKYLSKTEVVTLRKHSRRAFRVGKPRKFLQFRNWMMIELGVNAGLRVNEMATLKHKDLILGEERSSIRVLGKGQRERFVWIGTQFKADCQRYNDVKNRFGLGISGEEYLLTSTKGKRITKRALQNAFKKLVRSAGLPSHYHIHCLRHTYTTFLLKASNYNYEFARKQLGHASIRTTQVYAGVLESEGKRALEALYQ